MSKADLPEVEAESAFSPPKTRKTHEEVMGHYYATIAKRDVTFARSAYAGFSEKAGDSDKKELAAVAAKLPDNYEMILCTDYLEDTKKHQYRAMVFINRDTKEVVIANSGTRFGAHKAGRSDLYNDAYIMMSKKPPKMKSIETLNDMILDNLGKEAGEYKLHYTGHSLGASLSDLAAADMALKCRKRGISLDAAGEKRISTMTFENPGSKKIIEKMYDKAGLDHALYSQDADYRGINNKRNLINQATSPAGQMWEIVPEGQQNKMNLAQRSAFYMARKFQKVLPVIGRLFETFAMGSVIKQMKTHSLHHFNDVLCEERGEVGQPEAAPKRERWWLSELFTKCKKVLCSKEVAQQLSSMKEKQGDIGKQEFVMETDSGLLTASEAEAKKAIGSVDKKPAVSTASYVDRVRESGEASKEIAAGVVVVPTLEAAVGASRGRV